MTSASESRLMSRERRSGRELALVSKKEESLSQG